MHSRESMKHRRYLRQPMREDTYQRYLTMVQGHAEGLTMEEIADKQCASLHTVRQGFDRLRAYHRAQTIPHLVAILFRESLLK